MDSIGSPEPAVITAPPFSSERPAPSGRLKSKLTCSGLSSDLRTEKVSMPFGNAVTAVSVSVPVLG